MTLHEAIGVNVDVDIKTGKKLTHSEVYGRAIEYLGGLDEVAYSELFCQGPHATYSRLVDAKDLCFLFIGQLPAAILVRLERYLLRLIRHQIHLLSITFCSPKTGRIEKQYRTSVCQLLGRGMYLRTSPYDTRCLCTIGSRPSASAV